MRSPASLMRADSLPSSVFAPVATTSARPLPRTTLVPTKSIVARSPIGASSATAAAASLPAGIDSPVSADSSAAMLIV